MDKGIKEALIKQLAAGQFVSGQQLGEQFGVSRAAISKHVKGLKEMGLDVFRVTGKGYKLEAPIQLLEQEQINNRLAESASPAKADVYSIIDSTNDHLMRRLPNNIEKGQVCIAEYQSAGRGRRGRQWISPFGSHLYFSMYWRLDKGMSAAMGLNIIAALAVSDAIKALYNIDVQLKWPNDVYLDGVKLAGILIDLDGQALEPCHCVIGIGLNIKMPATSAEQVDQPWTDISQHLDEPIDRNELVAEIIHQLCIRLAIHEVEQDPTIISQWQARDYFYNKPVRLISGEKEIQGICQGIDQQGALMLKINGELKAMYGGELSLRAANTDAQQTT